MSEQARLKRLRTESLLRELVSEALAGLDDELLRGICVVEVSCARGRQDAVVYIDKAAFSQAEQTEILARLGQAGRAVEGFCARAQGWYRCAKLHFKFDESLERQRRLDELFEKIKR